MLNQLYLVFVILVNLYGKWLVINWTIFIYNLRFKVKIAQDASVFGNSKRVKI
jgi:hypothetical protein